MAGTYAATVFLSTEATERLMAIRDFLEDSLNVHLTLNEVCSTIINQVELRGFID